MIHLKSTTLAYLQFLCLFRCVCRYFSCTSFSGVVIKYVLNASLKIRWSSFQSLHTGLSHRVILNRSHRISPVHFKANILQGTWDKSSWWEPFQQWFEMNSWQSFQAQLTGLEMFRDVGSMPVETINLCGNTRFKLMGSTSQIKLQGTSLRVGNCHSVAERTQAQNTVLGKWRAKNAFTVEEPNLF